MNTEIRYQPAFATLFATLMPGDRVLAESGAMASMDSATEMTTRFNGGFFRALLRRIFGGETLFINEFRCKSGAAKADVVLTQPTPGDMARIDLQGNTLFLQPGAFVACGPGVKLGMGFAGLRSWFSGEGLFRLKVSGNGPVWIGAYGGIFTRNVDREYIVDTGHLVAYEPTVRLRIGLAGGVFSSLFGGEGFVSRMQGQGLIYLQSRNFGGLADWTNSHLY